MATTGIVVATERDDVYPVQVFWDGVAYTVDYRARDGTWWYRNRVGGMIYGRLPLFGRVRGGSGRNGSVLEGLLGKGNSSADVTEA